MTKETSPIGDYAIPAVLGILIAILVGLYIPQLTVTATESGMGLSGNAQAAFEDTVRRLNGVMQGDFSDTAAWGVPVFGFVIGCFFRFITGEEN